MYHCGVFWSDPDTFFLHEVVSRSGFKNLAGSGLRIKVKNLSFLAEKKVKGQFIFSRRSNPDPVFFLDDRIRVKPTRIRKPGYK